MLPDCNSENHEYQIECSRSIVEIWEVIFPKSIPQISRLHDELSWKPWEINTQRPFWGVFFFRPGNIKWSKISRDINTLVKIASKIPFQWILERLLDDPLAAASCSRREECNMFRLSDVCCKKATIFNIVQDKHERIKQKYKSLNCYLLSWDIVKVKRGTHSDGVVDILWLVIKVSGKYSVLLQLYTARYISKERNYILLREKQAVWKR